MFMKTANTHFLGSLGVLSIEFEFVLNGFDESERFGVTNVDSWIMNFVLWLTITVEFSAYQLLTRQICADSCIYNSIEIAQRVFAFLWKETRHSKRK